MTAIESQPLSSDSWELSRRVEAWAGEIRVNLIRIAAIVLFYGRHLIEVMLAPKDSPVRGEYHLRVTAVVLGPRRSEHLEAGVAALEIDAPRDDLAALF